MTEKVELKKDMSPFFIARSVTRPPSPSEVVLSDSTALRMALCHVGLGYFLTAHLRGNNLFDRRDMHG
jgi:hypothetical protein